MIHLQLGTLARDLPATGKSPRKMNTALHGVREKGLMENSNDSVGENQNLSVGAGSTPLHGRRDQAMSTGRFAELPDIPTRKRTLMSVAQ